MNPTSKAFGISLAFHTFMALIAVTLLMAMRNPSEPFSLPLKHMTLVSLSETSQTAAPLIHHPVTPMQNKAPIAAKAPNKPAPAMSPVQAQTAATASMQPLSAPVQPAPSAPAIQASESSNKAAPVSAPAKIASLPKAPPKVDINAEKQTFFASLRTIIQQHLRYPTAARRRGMEGDVNVRFVLDNTGAIREVNVRQGESIFHNAAKLAVASASGVKIPEVLSETLPAEIELILEFRLN